MNTRRILSAIQIWEAGGGFALKLRGIMKLRGQRIRDTLVLLATVSVCLIVSPLRFALFILHPLFPGASSRSVWARLQRRLNSVDSSAVFDCVVANSYGLLKLRRGTPDLWFAVDEFDKPVKEAFAVKEGEVVVDVGAYIGDYTIRASRLVGSTGKVIAVEAEPSNFDALLKRQLAGKADGDEGSRR